MQQKNPLAGDYKDLPSGKPLHIALIADLNVEVGLHVTLASLLHHLDGKAICHFHLFVGGFSEDNKLRLKRTLSRFKKPYNLSYYDLHNYNLGTGRSLRGQRSPYMLFHIPDVIEAEYVLYLDADLLVLSDVSDLFRFVPTSAAVSAVSHSPISKAFARDKKFLLELLRSPDDPYFNTGVVLFDCKRWVQETWSKQCFDLIKQFPDRLFNTDQTVFNVVLGKRSEQLPSKYNIYCSPGHSAFESVPNDSIVHFIGVPKPWDLFAEQLHSNYALFEEWLLQTEFCEHSGFRKIDLRSVKRMIRSSRAYLRFFRHRYLQHSGSR